MFMIKMWKRKEKNPKTKVAWMDGQFRGDTVTLTGDTETQCNQKEAMASAPLDDYMPGVLAREPKAGESLPL